MTKLAVAIVGFALAGCVQSQPMDGADPPMPYSITPTDRAAIIQSVKGKLKDPDSANFDLILATQRGNAPVKVCGYVKARNSFGGYTGNEIFLGILSSSGTRDAAFLTTDISSESDKFDLARGLCARDGVILPRL